MQELTALQSAAIWAVIVVSVLAVGYAFLLRSQILRRDTGSDRMREVAGFIQEGADAYLRRQFNTIVILVVVLAIVLAASVLVVPPTRAASEMFGDGATLWIAVGRAVSFLIGASFSYAVGFFGMKMAVEANVRVAAAAMKGYNPALQVAYTAGAVTGLLAVGLGLLGAAAIFLVYGIAAPDALLGFAFGASLIALFMRVGGGIYTKAADVGADLVGKVEAGIPEDDPRNAAVIADLVGDNVGDCAGMAADVYESYAVVLVSALILGLALGDLTVGTVGDGQYDIRFVVLPLLLYGVGTLASIIGNQFVRTDDQRRNALAAMKRGFYISSVIAVVGFAAVTALFIVDPATGVVDWRPFFATTVGIVLVLVLDKLTEFYTSARYSPVKEVAKSSQSGPATSVLSGLSLGMDSSVWATLVLGAAVLGSVLIYATEPVATQLNAILYGVSLTGIGMLALAGSTLSQDSFGPISDNANGIGEMSGLDKNARNVMDDLDAVGNTTKAATKGVAIGSAVIAAVGLFGAFLIDVGHVQEQLNLEPLTGINIANPLVFVGLLVGGTLPMLFSSLTIRAVSRAAVQMVAEVRRQFKIPGVMEGTTLPDYRQAVGISTTAAQRELVSLGAIALLFPVLVGFLLGVEALGGFLGGVILAGQLMAVFQANAGGAWDNAKKHIEDGFHGGKNSEAHKAAVVGDTVGDPLKDTSGPAINPMIKVVNLIALIVGPVVVAVRLPNEPLSLPIIAAMVVCAAVLTWALWQSGRERPGEAATIAG